MWELPKGMPQAREHPINRGRPFVQQATGDGATTAFYLDRKPRTAADLQVFVNGALTRDYTLDGTKVTLTAAPSAGQDIDFHVFGGL